jgi:hypothetical protein
MNIYEDKLLFKIAELKSKIKNMQIQNESKYYTFIQETRSNYEDIMMFDLEYLKVQKLYYKADAAVQRMSSQIVDDSYDNRIVALKLCYRILHTIILKIVDYSIMFFQKIESLKSRPQSPYELSDGAEWFHFMCQVYLNNNGKYNVSTVEFFKHFKNVWHELSDHETFEIAHVTEDMFGGHSITNIAHNLERWIRNNQDCLRVSEIAIFRL